MSPKGTLLPWRPGRAGPALAGARAALVRVAAWRKSIFNSSDLWRNETWSRIRERRLKRLPGPGEPCRRETSGWRWWWWCYGGTDLDDPNRFPVKTKLKKIFCCQQMTTSSKNLKLLQLKVGRPLNWMIGWRDARQLGFKILPNIWEIFSN